MALRPTIPAWREVKGIVATPTRQNLPLYGLRQPHFAAQGRTHPQHPAGTDALMAQGTYVLRMTSGSGAGGSGMDGNIRRRTTNMVAPQQVHSHGGRACTVA